MAAALAAVRNRAPITRGDYDGGEYDASAAPPSPERATERRRPRDVAGRRPRGCGEKFVHDESTTTTRTRGDGDRGGECGATRAPWSGASASARAATSPTSSAANGRVSATLAAAGGGEEAPAGRGANEPGAGADGQERTRQATRDGYVGRRCGNGGDQFLNGGDDDDGAARAGDKRGPSRRQGARPFVDASACEYAGEGGDGARRRRGLARRFAPAPRTAGRKRRTPTP